MASLKVINGQLYRKKEEGEEVQTSSSAQPSSSPVYKYKDGQLFIKKDVYNSLKSNSSQGILNTLNSNAEDLDYERRNRLIDEMRMNGATESMINDAIGDFVPKKDVAQTVDYSSLVNNADYEANKDYRSTKHGEGVRDALSGYMFDNGYDDIEHDIINKDNLARLNYNVNMGENLAADNGYLDYLEQNEVDTYNYLYNTQGKDKAKEYINSIKNDLYKRQTDSNASYWNAEMDKSPVNRALGSVESVILGLGRPLDTLGMALDYLQTGSVNENKNNRATSTVNAIRENVGKHWGEAFSNYYKKGKTMLMQNEGYSDEEIADELSKDNGEQFGNFAYQTMMSMADFLTTALATGNFSEATEQGKKVAEGLSLAIMGAGATPQTVIEAKERGADDGQALLLGAISGLAEVVTERVSVEALLDPNMLKDDAIKYIAKNFLSEGAEEVGSDLINLVADLMIMADKSELAQRIQELMKEGMSEGEAYAKALGEQALNMGADFLGGAISGGIMGASGVAINNFTNYRNGVNFNLQSPENMTAVLDEAFASNPEGHNYQQAMDILTKMQNDESYTPSAREMGELWQRNIDVVDKSEMARAEDEQRANEIIENMGNEGKYVVNNFSNPNADQVKYTSAMTDYYLGGMNGTNIEDINSVNGDVLNDIQKQAAYEAGINDKGANNNEGNISLSQSEERNDGTSAEIKIGGMAEESAKSTVIPKDSGASSLKTGEYVERTIGTSRAKFTTIVSGETESMKMARQIAKDNGMEVEFFSGIADVFDNGKRTRVRGLIHGNKIYVQVDHPDFSADQLAHHEVTHKKLNNGEIDKAKTVAKIKETYKGKEFDTLVNMYASAYNWMSADMTDEEIDAIVDETLDEMICDAVGGINIFKGKIKTSEKIYEPFLQNLKGSIVKSDNQANAPPIDDSGFVDFGDIDEKDLPYNFSMEMPVEATKTMIAWHNMSADAMREALELGGLAMPSFAIKPAESVHSEFGEISVIAPRDSIDPAKSKNQKIFNGDAWTPTFPRVDYKIDDNAIYKLRNRTAELLGKVGLTNEDVGLHLDVDNAADKIQRFDGTFYNAYGDETGMKLAYILDKDMKVQLPYKEKHYTNYADISMLKKIIKEFGIEKPLTSEEIRKAEPKLRRMMHEYQANKYNENIADKMTPLDAEMPFSEIDSIFYSASQLKRTGETKTLDMSKLRNRVNERIKTKKAQAEYRAWVEDLSNDVISKKGIRNEKDMFSPSGNRRSFDSLHYDYNLSNIIRAMNEQPKQGGGGFFGGAGAVKGATLKSFESIEEMKNSLQRFADFEEYSKAYDEFKDKVAEVSKELHDDIFTGSEIVAEVLQKHRTAESVYRYLNKEYSFLNPNRTVSEHIADLVKYANELPIEYFESKLYRAFSLEEALAYVVPNNIDKSLKQQMIDRGLNIKTYKSGDNEDRLKKVNSIKGAQFSREIVESFYKERQDAELYKLSGQKYFDAEMNLYSKYQSAATSDYISKYKADSNNVLLYKKGQSQSDSSSLVLSYLNESPFYDDKVTQGGEKINPESNFSQEIDAQGNKLSEEQADYFKDSKVRDENGNLLVVYHGTRKADFTVFNRTLNYFTDSEAVADSYAPSSEKYEGYLNITKPFVVDAKQSKWSGIPVEDSLRETIKQYGGSVFKENGKWRTSTADIAYAILDMVDEGEGDYDGIIIRNLDDTGSYYKESDVNYGNDYITFNSNQFKNIDNLNPTENEDIRFSEEIDSWLDSLSVEDLIEDLKVETSEIKPSLERRVDEVNKMLKQIGLQFNGTKKVAWTDEHIEKALESYAATNKEYAQAYITYISPTQFLNLTMGSRAYTVDRIVSESAEYGNLDTSKLNNGAMFLDIEESKNGAKVIGHEGRHRMLLLGKAGFEKVPILIFNYDNKYSKTSKESLKLKAQRFFSGELISKSRDTIVRDVIPFSRGNHELIIEKFGSGTNADIRYSREAMWEAKAGYVDNLMSKNAEIETLTDEQHDALRWLAKIRHDMHTNTEEAFNSESSIASDFANYIDTEINERLSNAGLPTISLPDIADIPSSEDFYLFGNDEYEDFQDWKEHSGEYQEYFDIMSDINKSIEDYLRTIDKEHGTQYAPTGNARAKMWMSEEPTRLNDIQKENDNLKKEINSLKAEVDKWKSELRISAPLRVRNIDADTLAKKLIKKYSSKASVSSVTNKLLNLGDYMLNSNDEDYADRIKSVAVDVASDIVNKAEVLTDDGFGDIYNDLTKYARKGISISVQDRADIPDFNDFRKSNFGRLKITNDGIKIDSLYQELNGSYPDLFPSSITHPAEQLKHFAEVLNDIAPHYENPYLNHGIETAEVVDSIANEIIAESMSMKATKKTFADRQETKKTEIKSKADERIKKLQQKRNDDIAKLKAEYKDRAKAKRISTAEKQLRERIERHTKKLQTKLLSPTDKSHIPQAYQSAVARLLESINLSSTYRTINGKRVNVADIPFEESGIPTKRSEAFATFRKQYEEMVRDGYLALDEALLGTDGLLEDVVQMGETPLGNLGLNDLHKILTCLKAVEGTLNYVDKAFSTGKYNRISEVAEKLYNDNMGKNQKGDWRFSIMNNIAIDMLTPEAFFHRLGDMGDWMFSILRAAQDKRTMILNQAVEFNREALKNIKPSKMENAEVEVTLGGRNIKMSKADLMELYVLSKREKARNHILAEGIKLKEPSKKGLKTFRMTSSVKNITELELGQAFTKLTPEEIDIADTMQKFLSTTMAEYGNQASMEVYNYEKFNEDNYWRMVVDKGTLKDKNQREDVQSTSVANMGMTKPTVQNAKNPLMIGSIFDSYSEHIVEMANYSSYLAPQEDINRIRNFVIRDDEGNKYYIKNAISNAIGSKGESYLRQLMSDIANGVKSEQDYFGGLFGKYKAAAVGANLRVILQQPTAILRAMDMISPKYMFGGLIPQGGWKKAVEWSPIARWKDWGYFDINSGKQMKDVLLPNNDTLTKVQEWMMMPAGWADSIAWGQLWNAVELETRAEHKELEVGSREYYEFCAERFAKIIDHSQVVDGILQRSQAMRDKSMYKKMLTSFMGEPTKQYNQLLSAVYDVRQGKKNAGKMLTRTVFAMAIAGTMNALAQSIVDAMRHSNRDKDYWEQLLEEMTGIKGDEESIADYVKNGISGNLESQFNPLTYIIGVKDAWNIIEGYEVDRMDISMLSDLISSAKKMVSYISGESNMTWQNASSQLLTQIAKFVGLPVANIEKDFHAIIDSILINPSDDYALIYEKEKLFYDIDKTDKNYSRYSKILYEAYQNDRSAYEYIFNDLLSHGYDSDKLVSSMNTYKKNTEGAKSISDMSEKVIAPSKESKYTSTLNKITSSSVYKNATEEQKEDLRSKAYSYANGTSDSLNSAVEKAEKSGLSATDYMLYSIAKKMVDKPNKNGNLGTYTNDEKIAAARLVGIAEDKIRAYENIKK